MLSCLCTIVMTPADFVSRCRGHGVPGDAYTPGGHVHDAEPRDAVAVCPAVQSHRLAHGSVNHRGNTQQHILIWLQPLNGEG